MGQPIKETKSEPESQDSGTPIGIIFLILAVLGGIAYFLKSRNTKSKEAKPPKVPVLPKETKPPLPDTPPKKEEPDYIDSVRARFHE